MISVRMREWCLVRSRCSSCTWSFRPWISVCSICAGRGQRAAATGSEGGGCPHAPRAVPRPYPVGVLVVAAVLGEGRLAPLGQQDLGADVPVQRRLPHHGARGHLIAAGGAAGHDEGLGGLADGDPARRATALWCRWWQGEVPGGRHRLSPATPGPRLSPQPHTAGAPRGCPEPQDRGAQGWGCVSPWERSHQSSPNAFLRSGARVSWKRVALPQNPGFHSEP